VAMDREKENEDDDYENDYHRVYLIYLDLFQHQWWCIALKNYDLLLLMAYCDFIIEFKTSINNQSDQMFIN